MRRVGTKCVLAWTAGLLLCLPSAAEAHFLTLARARGSLLEFAYGVAYSYPISRAPRVRCARSNPHAAYCDWSFVRENAQTEVPVAYCSGRYRVFLRTGSSQTDREVVRRLSCRALS